MSAGAVGEANLTLEGRAQCSQLDDLEAVWGQPTDTGAPLRARDRPRPREPSRATLVPPAGRSRTASLRSTAADLYFRSRGARGPGSRGRPAQPSEGAVGLQVGGRNLPGGCWRGRRASSGAAGGLPQPDWAPLRALRPNAASRRPRARRLLQAGRRSSRGAARCAGRGEVSQEDA